MKKLLVFFFLIFALSNHSFSQWRWINPLPQGHPLESIKAIDSLRCIAVGDHGTLMSTKDGGQTWNIFNDSAKRFVTAVEITDSLNAWAIGYGGLRYHTTDGGITWSEQLTGTYSCNQYEFDFSDS